MKGIAVIVGRPNVGKSTLYNRLTKSKDAIVDEKAGVTRDRHYGIVEWNGEEFTLVDTGGWIKGSDDDFEELIRKQVALALKEADLVLFLVDLQSGITGTDDQIADLIRKSGIPCILVVNKTDEFTQIPLSHEFYRLGFEHLFPISAVNGLGTGDLLDQVLKMLPEKTEAVAGRKDLPYFTIVGKPNVGKSTFLNTLLGEERSIVSPVAGTTRDPVETLFKGFNMEFYLVDTAGLRKKNKIKEDIEFYSTIRTIRSIEKSDVCFLLLDATEGINHQDLQIVRYIVENKKGLVVLVNKWDLVENKTSNTAKEYESLIKKRLQPFDDVPVVFISALHKVRILKGLEAGMKVYENRTKKIPTSQLNEVLLPIIENNPPPAIKGKYIKIKYVTQLPTHAPSFAFFCNLPQYVKEPYKRFLENQIRKNFNFTGVPVQIFFRKK